MTDAPPADGAGPFAPERLAHYEDEQAAVRAALALDAGRMGAWRWDITGGTVTGDPFVAELLRLDFDAQPWPVGEVFASMHPDDLPRVQREVDRALEGADLYAVEFRDTAPVPGTQEAGLRWLGARGRVTARGEGGEPLEMIGVNWDATAQKVHEAHLQALAAEMDHRVKNAFAVIRALVNLGRRTPGSKAAFADALRAQVQALSDAHAVSAGLARAAEAPAVPVPVGEIAARALAPWPGRVRLDADEGVVVPPRDVSPLAMLFGELVADARRRGALASRGGGPKGGKDDVSVRVRQENGTAVIEWRERVSNEAVGAATRVGGDQNGFGTVLLDHCVRTLRAGIERDPAGLVLRVPLENGRAENG